MIKNYISVMFLLTIVFLINIPLFIYGQENLDELISRKSRLASATWGYQYLEEALNNFYWQNETVMYNDIQTGNEVWRMSSTSNLNNYYHNDIGVTPWSADGKRLAFFSDRNTGAFSRNYIIWMIVNTDGKYLRPISDAPSREKDHTEYFHWSPQIPDVYYEFWRNSSGHTGYNETDLMKITVDDNAVSNQLLISFPTTHSSELFLNKTISGDGRKIIAMPWSENWNYPATIFPESSAGLDDSDGYIVDRDMDSFWGDTPPSYSAHHDQYYAGNGTWWYILTSGSHAWWRLKVLGSASDGGSIYSFTTPNIFDEQWPENTVSDWGGNRDPFGCEYWSHFVPDRWGRHALFSNTESFNNTGTGIWDIMNHIYSVESFQQGCQHHDWHGFTDWTISTTSSSEAITTQKFNDEFSIQTVCYTHSRFNGGTSYGTLPRPGQSPDGTKVAWHSEFLNASGVTDIFWAVAYNPYPPTDLEATYDGGVKISWLPPKYSERGWPYAESNPTTNSLGWPLTDGNGNEIGEPLYAREINRYNIWRSQTGISDWQLIGNTLADYDYTYTEDPDLFMLHPVVNGLKVDNNNKVFFVDNPGDGTFYYAVTSEEHSGLESKELSDIIEVIITVGTISNSGISQPQGFTGFWTSLPSAPTNFTYLPTGTTGHVRLDWTEPQDTKIRFYNIYYSLNSIPPAQQQYRIASIPVGTSTYLDWVAESGAFYRITSVDRYGNEGLEITNNNRPGNEQNPRIENIND